MIVYDSALCRHPMAARQLYCVEKKLARQKRKGYRKEYTSKHQSWPLIVKQTFIIVIIIIINLL